MPTFIHCPHCGKQIGIPDNSMGKPVKCPLCQKVFNSPVVSPVEGYVPGSPRKSRSRDELRPHRGMLVLILGLVGFFFWIPGLIAWFLGTRDLQAMDKGEMDPDGRDLTNIGKSLGMISTFLLAAALLAVIIGLLIPRISAAFGPAAVARLVAGSCVAGVVAFVVMFVVNLFNKKK